MKKWNTLRNTFSFLIPYFSFFIFKGVIGRMVWRLCMIHNGLVLVLVHPGQ